MKHSVRGSSADGAPSLQRTLSEPFAASAPAGDAVAWLRDVGQVASDGQYDECLIVCSKGDPGSFPVYAGPPEPSPSSRSETAGEVGLNWQISREAKAQIEEIESNTRNALLNAHKIVAGQLPPSPDCSGCRPSGVQERACIEGAVTAEDANAKSGGAA